MYFVYFVGGCGGGQPVPLRVGGILQPQMLGGLQDLSWPQSCLSCRPGYHLHVGQGCGSGSAGPVGPLCSIVPSPGVHACQVPPLRLHHIIGSGEASCDGGERIPEAQHPRASRRDWNAGLTYRKAAQEWKCQGRLTQRHRQLLRCEGFLGNDSQRAIYFPGCATPDKMKCIPDIQNFPGKISLSRSPVRSEK